MSSVHINGLRDLYARLSELPDNIQRNILRGAIRAGSTVIANEARRLCPVEKVVGGGKRNGTLRASIRVKSVQGALGQKFVGGITAGRGKAFYAHFVEFGTAAHVIKAKNDGWLSIGGNLVKQVSHPGAKRQPFMRPALDTKAQEAIAAFRDYTNERIRKWLAKNAKAPGPR